MPALTDQQKYDDASAALHQLKLGRAVVSVTDQNGEKVTFQAADMASLQAYVDELGEGLGLIAKTSFAPLRFIF